MTFHGPGHVDVGTWSGQFNFGIIYCTKYFMLQWISIPVNVPSDLTKPSLPCEFTYLRVDSLRERGNYGRQRWKWVNRGIILYINGVCVYMCMCVCVCPPRNSTFHILVPRARNGPKSSNGVICVEVSGRPNNFIFVKITKIAAICF